MANAYYLTDSDLEVLKEVIADHRTRPRSSRRGGEQVTVAGSPEVYVVKIPENGIPARSGTTVFSALCEVYSFTDGTTSTLTAVSSLTVRVWNIYPVKVYGQGTPYRTARRDKFGRWLCEKPPFTHFVVPEEDISPGDSGTCQVVVGGSPADSVEVHLSWMEGSTLISAGREATAEYKEDQGQWVFTNAECEPEEE